MSPSPHPETVLSSPDPFNSPMEPEAKWTLSEDELLKKLIEDKQIKSFKRLSSYFPVTLPFNPHELIFGV